MLIDPTYQRILVIRLGALGDLVLCNGAFQAIRTAYPRAIITLLTQPAWLDFTRSMPWFDHVISDARPEVWDIGAWFDLLRRVRHADPQCVFDLQGKNRQNLLYALLGGSLGGVHWSGATKFCRYPRIWPPRPDWHFTDFIAAQLQVAGLTPPAQSDFEWFDAPVDDLDLPEHFALLIPGCSPKRLEKRWPASSYAALARKLQANGLDVVMIGSQAEADALKVIKTQVPSVHDLGGRTSLLQIGAIARRAKVVIGNDTGPSHIAAAMGVPTLTLVSRAINPVWSCPKGVRAVWIQADDLAALPVEQVLQKLQDF